MRLEIVAEAARLEAATQRFLDGFDRSLSMPHSRIGLIAPLMWLRPLSRLVVVQNVQGTVRFTTSARQAASENERTNKKTNHTRHHCYQTSTIVDIIVIRRVEVWVTGE